MWPSNRLTECKTFQALSPAEKAEVIRGQGGCVVCGSWGHIRAKCNREGHPPSTIASPHERNI